LSDHQDLKAALQDTYDEAKRLRDEAQNTIDVAATNRATEAAIKELEERNKAFYDLEGQKMSEEDQVNNLTNEYNDWINLRNQNATDDELFDEFDARATQTLTVLEETQTKLDATTALYEVEYALK
jgi:DNA repair exonuclease SbcCD ATPase subunit